MNLLKNTLLWASENPWMRDRLPQYRFVKRAVKKFMPGEEAADALEAAERFRQAGIPVTLTYLGENIRSLAEAEEAASAYGRLLRETEKRGIDAEVSLKLTHIGLNLSYPATLEQSGRIAGAAGTGDVWIDMEGSTYTDTTLRFYREILQTHQNAGVCLQAYLYRTEKDLHSLLPLNPKIRLVKGAYQEPPQRAFPRKPAVDRNYFHLAEQLLPAVRDQGIRVAFATHDMRLVRRILDLARRLGVPRERLEFQMLYGIRSAEQLQLAEEGYRIRVLISYGRAWFPWYMRRLAERPANVGFVLKNLFSG